MPEDRVVVLGLVTTKKPKPESPQELEQRIKEASRFVPLDRLGLSPQCGFASSMEADLLTQDDQRRKLELVGKVSKTVWG